MSLDVMTVDIMLLGEITLDKMSVNEIIGY
jgi:hypothetical protein